MLTEPGRYYGQIVGQDATNSKKGSPQIRVMLQVGHYWKGRNDDEGEWIPLDESLQRTLYLSLTENAWQYSEKKLETLGFNGSFTEPAFTETGIDLVCKRGSKKDGTPCENWEMKSWGDGASDAEPIDANTMRTLNARWKQEHGAPPPAGKPTAPPPAEKPADDTASAPPIEPPGDDIPF